MAYPVLAHERVMQTPATFPIGLIVEHDPRTDRLVAERAAGRIEAERRRFRQHEREEVGRYHAISEVQVRGLETLVKGARGVVGHVHHDPKVALAVMLGKDNIVGR